MTPVLAGFGESGRHLFDRVHWEGQEIDLDNIDRETSFGIRGQI